ncbi:FG-GAP repeat domain-containing protein [Streptomyces melanogenes]|uniref:FG-GAP repeat domain-containing protein n=1 Tax=Streptomyces melanogenes TaxID=67326 RepID=UPI00378C3DDC
MTAAVFGTALGVTPLQSAAAQTTNPVLSLRTSEAIDVYGSAGDIDITLTVPPEADSYLLLTLGAPGDENLTLTDDSGAPVTTHQFPDRPRYAEFGKEDSDHDGVPGAALTPGTIHLHVAADGLVARTLYVGAYVVDGATDTLWNARGTSAEATMTVGQALLGSTWTSPGQGSGWQPTIPVVTGQTEPAEIRLETRMTMRKPPAATRNRWLFTAAEIADKGYTAGQLAQALQVQHSGDGTTFTPLAWIITADGSLVLELPQQTWPDDRYPVVQQLRLKAQWGLPAGYLNGTVETFDRSGVVYGSTRKTFEFIDGSLPATARAAFYGRDRAGVLWQYQSSPDRDPSHYTRRTQVGGGWQTYNTLTKLSTLKADGTGDLVARDGSGTLWYYKATGNITSPFASRTKVGGGWQTYTMLTGAGDLTGDGKADLLARDRDGVLWLYRGTGNPASPFQTRTKVGGGWNTYTELIGGADLTGDGKADLLARDRDGVLWLYRGTGNPAAPYATRARIGGGWNTYTRILSTGDTTGDGKADLLAVDSDGGLWHYRGTGNPASPFQTRTRIGTGWNTYNTLI